MCNVRKSLLLLISVLLVSCTTVPKIDEKEYVKVSDILYTVECELRDAIKQLVKDFPWASQQKATAILKIKVVESGAGDGDASLVVPITNGTFTLGLTAGLTRKATREASLTVDYDLSKLECRQPDGLHDVPTRIEGGLGFSEWLNQSARALSRARETPTGMSYSVDFDIIAKGSVNPKFGVELPSGRKYGAGIKVTGTRQRIHNIQISAVGIVPGRPGVTKRRLDREVTQFLLRNRNN